MYSLYRLCTGLPSQGVRGGKSCALKGLYCLEGSAFLYFIKRYSKG